MWAKALLALSMLLLYTAEDAHLVMPSLPASICAQQRELSSKIKTESKPSMPDRHRLTLQTVLLTCVWTMFLSCATHLLHAFLTISRQHTDTETEPKHCECAWKNCISVWLNWLQHLTRTSVCQTSKASFRPRTISVWRLCTKTTTLHGKTRTTPLWSSWW